MEHQLKFNTRLLTSLSDVLLMSSTVIIEKTNIKPTTWYRIMAKPDEITVQQLLAVANNLCIPVRRFFFSGKVVPIDRREDYIFADFQPCRYEPGVLQKLVETRRDITWQKAADATGMTYDNLKKSLLSIRRTPIDRVVKTCEAFGIDLFSVLIDPNKSHKRKDGRRAAEPSKEKPDDALLTEITALRENVGRLNDTVSEVTEKYEDLLTKYDRLLNAHRALLDRFNTHVREGFAALAADPLKAPAPDR